MSEVREWFDSLPFFTRWWLLLTVVFSLLGRFHFLSPELLALFYKQFVNNFELWRAVTCVLYYPVGFSFLVNCYFLYSYSLRLERGEFDGRPADYFYMLLFNWVCCVIAGLIGEFPLLMDPMVLSVLYLWCQLNPDVIVNFWFGTQFKAIYLPWVLFGFNLVISGGGMLELVGIIVGHLYFYLKFKYPQEFGGPDLLATPGFIESYFPRRRVTGFGSVPVQREAPQQRGNWGGHQWGRGQPLGQ